MLPVKTILCPTDFSTSSFEGVARAGELAQHFGAQLTLVNVVNPVPTIVSTDPLVQAQATGVFNVDAYQRDVETSALERLRDISREYVPNDVDVQCLVRRGSPAKSILGLARESDVDLIVIATHGRTGMRRMVLGSVTERVVREAERPVLTVHLET